MSSSLKVEALRTAGPVVLPSLLLCDFANLEREVRALEAAGVKALHLDVMDGNFVPNLTYGMLIVAALKKITKLPLDVHLMIERPQRYLRQFADAGADVITFHIEAAPEPLATIDDIHALGLKAGLALNPATDLGTLAASLDFVDLVLVMSVPAGFGGQKFHDVALDKLRSLKARVRPEVILEVDGGINASTIGRCAQAGAQWFVVGSALFGQPGSGQPNYGEAVRSLTQLARS